MLILKQKNLFLLIFLTIIWSLFFAIYKYFIWWIFKTDTITLQSISAYLSIWWIFAFIIWWLIYEIFKEKIFHLIIWFSSILWLFGILIFYYYPIINNYIIVAFFTFIIWFFYWMWWILKNVIIASEIRKEYSTDTKINWFVNISFITSIIIWSILWWFLVEKMSIYGIYLIIFWLILALICWFFLSNSKSKLDELSLKNKISFYKKSYLTDFIFIFKKYFINMIFIWLLLTIATILSQKAIEYNVKNMSMKQSIASSILLYSAVWSIIWNVFSMKIKEKSKWLFFMIFCFIFAFFTILLPIFIENFNTTKIIAFLAWGFFWISYNLIESDFFKNIWIDEKKSYGWASLWIIISIVIASMMFLIDFIEKILGFTWSYLFLASITILIWISFYLKHKEKKKKFIFF